MQVHNPTTQPIKLLGAQSFVVDQRGQSHPLRSQTIGPQSFIKLVRPPVRTPVAPGGPVIGIGIGAGFERAYYGPGYATWDAFYEPYWTYPRYYSENGDSDYWDWSGQTDVRLDLTFQEDDFKPFSQEFTFRRRKM